MFPEATRDYIRAHMARADRLRAAGELGDSIIAAERAMVKAGIENPEDLTDVEFYKQYDRLKQV